MKKKIFSHSFLATGQVDVRMKELETSKEAVLLRIENLFL